MGEVTVTMRTRLTAISGLAVLGLTMAAMSACTTPGSSSGSSGGSGGGQMLTMSTPTEPDSLDPTFANTFAANMVFTSFCEKLYDTDQNLKIVPELAAAMPKIAKNGLSEDIKIKPGVKFNDGTPLNAEAVKTSLDRDLTAKGSARVQDLEAVKSVSVKDPMTVHIDLKHESAALTAQFTSRAGLVMSPTALKKEGLNFQKNPVCVGPFKYKSRVSGTSMTFVKSNDYYDKDKVKLAGVTYKFITDSSVATANLQSGDVDVAEHLAPSDVSKLQNNPDFKVLKSNTIAYQGVDINVDPKSGTDLSKSAKLREAFEMAIDRKTLNSAVWQNAEIVDCNPLPMQSPLRTNIPCTPYDVAGAKKLVQQSGIKSPSIELLVSSGDASVREGQAVQSMLEKVGFTVKIRTMDLVSGIQYADEGKSDAFLVGWSGRVDPDGDLNDLVTTGGSNNFSHLSDPTIDKLVREAATTYDQSQRKALYAQIVKRLDTIRSTIYLYHDRWYTGTSKNVSGIVYGPDGFPRLKTASTSSSGQ